MTFRASVAIAVVAGILAWTGPAAAGWVIDHVVRRGNESGRQPVTMQASRMKIVTFDGERPAMAVIAALNADTITPVDHRERRYTTALITAGTEMDAATELGPPTGFTRRSIQDLIGR
jgi:hypothetical protein